MADRSRKVTEPPLKLDMDFGEALTRFAQTKPKQVEESIERAKTKKPPELAPERPIVPNRRRKPSSDH